MKLRARDPNSDRIVVEAAVETVDDALAAEAAGAHRLELCADLDSGGTTPRLRVVEDVLRRVRIPIQVMVRPRGGDFSYSQDEIALMTEDIGTVRSLRPAGIVMGVTRSNRELHIPHLQRLLEATDGIPVTYHRAFDSLANPHAALEDLIELRLARVLTAGGESSAAVGAVNLAALVERAAGRITIVAGGGVRAHNVRDLIERTGVREVHARFIDSKQMQSLVAAARWRERVQ